MIRSNKVKVKHYLDKSSSTNIVYIIYIKNNMIFPKWFSWISNFSISNACFKNSFPVTLLDEFIMTVFAKRKSSLFVLNIFLSCGQLQDKINVYQDEEFLFKVWHFQFSHLSNRHKLLLKLWVKVLHLYISLYSFLPSFL